MRTIVFILSLLLTLLLGVGGVICLFWGLIPTLDITLTLIGVTCIMLCLYFWAFLESEYFVKQWFALFKILKIND